MNYSLGRFTALGGPHLEGLLFDWVQTIGSTIQSAIDPASNTSLLLIGGYGRGEGGVEICSASGEERPHNNLDLLLIAENDRHINTVQRQLRDPLKGLNESSPISIDLSVVSQDQIRRSPHLVLWYDIKHGHKTIFGDPCLIDSLRPRDSVERIAPWDMRNLLTNRATLLLINDHLVAHQASPDRRTLIRHAIKAIIGVGDALLFFLGDYHWSYLEKKRRMALRDDVDTSFRELYELAASFRLRPDYRSLESLDLSNWLANIRASFEPIHRQCESFRLGLHLDDWNHYLPQALLAELARQPTHWRSWAHKFRNLADHLFGQLTEGASLPGHPSKCSLGALMTSNANLLSLLFPLLAYPSHPPPAAQDLFALLATPDMPHDLDFRRLYLHAWAHHCDANFLSTLRRIEAPRSYSGVPS